jgi:hypothetical protein
MKTKTEIIKETVEYIQKNGRASKMGFCCYFIPETSQMCAVGRCLADPEKFQKIYGYKTINYVGSERLESSLRTEYQGHSEKFWQNLQFFHDNGLFWADKELTSQGKKNIKPIDGKMGRKLKNFHTRIDKNSFVVGREHKILEGGLSNPA